MENQKQFIHDELTLIGKNPSKFTKRLEKVVADRLSINLEKVEKKDIKGEDYETVLNSVLEAAFK